VWDDATAPMMVAMSDSWPAINCGRVVIKG
jgi:hypothetical protein